MILRGRVNDAYVLSLEAVGLFKAVLRALPPGIRDPIEAMIANGVEPELEAAYERAIDAVISEAGRDLRLERVACPLCGEGPATVYEGQEGFSYPFGLRKHLTGH